jgi:hypothetical protein
VPPTDYSPKYLELEERWSMKTLLVAVLERLSARNKVGDNVAEMVVVVLAAVLVAVLLSFAGASFGD